MNKPNFSISVIHLQIKKGETTMKTRTPITDIIQYIEQTDCNNFADCNLDLNQAEIESIFRQSDSIKKAIYLAYNLGLCVASNHIK